MSLVSLAKMISSDPRQDLTDVNFSNIKCVIKKQEGLECTYSPQDPTWV